MADGNLLENIPQTLPKEVFESILAHDSIKIERIVSYGHCSEDNFWYDQDKNEWVLLLSGEARLQFEDRTLHLKQGDYVNIKAHVRHRVAWTSIVEETIWLAIFY